MLTLEEALALWERAALADMGLRIKVPAKARKTVQDILLKARKTNPAYMEISMALPGKDEIWLIRRSPKPVEPEDFEEI